MEAVTVILRSCYLYTQTSVETTVQESVETKPATHEELMAALKKQVYA